MEKSVFEDPLDFASQVEKVQQEKKVAF